MREVITAKILYGRVRDEINSNINSYTFKFPADKESGLSTTYTSNSGTYLEVSVVIMNIFKFIGIYLFRRLKYLNHSRVFESGIKTRVKMDF